MNNSDKLKNVIEISSWCKKIINASISKSILLLCSLLIIFFIFPNILVLGNAYQYSNPNGIQSYHDPIPIQLDFFRGNFSYSNYSLLVNQTTAINFQMSPIDEVQNATIRFVLPYGVELTDGKLQWNGDVKKDEIIQFNITIKATTEIRGDIKADVYTLKNGTKIKQSYYASIFTNDVSTKETSKLSPTVTVDSTSIQTKATQITTDSNFITASNNNITIVGSISYDIGNGDSKPVRYATVVLVDDETLGEDEVAISHTNSLGEYYFNVDNDDGYLQGGRDVFVRIKCESSAAKTVDNNEILYETTTLIEENVPDGATVDFGSPIIGMDSAAWEAMDSVIDEYQWIDNRVGWIRPQITIRYPFGDWPRHNISYYLDSGEIVRESIDLPLKNTIPFGWDDITLFHEYGHAVMLSAYGYNANNMPTSTHRGESHFVFSEKDGGFALIEGWAEFMQAAVANDPNVLEENSQNIENNDWFNYTDDNDMDGNIIEGSVASILWDIFDEANDDDIYEGFDEIWSILKNDNPDDINEFWTHWFSTSDNTQINYGYDSQLWKIYYTYGIRIPDPNPPTSQVNPLSSTTSTTSFTVFWSGSDDLSGIKWYDIQVKDGTSGTWTTWRQGTYDTSYTFTGGQEGHTYYFRSRAVDNANNVETYPTNPDYDTVTSINTGPGDTQTTTGIISETHNCDSITITATYSGDSDNDGTAKLYYKKSSSSSWIYYGTMTKGSSQYLKTISGLAENTNYDVYVDYSDSDGVIGTNPIIYQYTINTGSCASSPPSTPILDNPGTTDADGSYRVTWSYHPDATYFNLEEGSSSSFLSPTTYAPLVNSKHFTGKGNGAYYYRVKSCNGNGCSGWSNTESITVSLGTISDNSYAGNMFGSVFTGDTTTVKDYTNGVYTVRVTGRYYVTSPRQLSVEIYKSGSLIDSSIISEETVYYFDNYNLQIFVTGTIYGPPMYGEAIAINTKTTSAEVDAVPSTITITQGNTGSIYFDIPTSTDGAYNDFFVGGTARDWVTNPPIQTYGLSTNELLYISSSPTNIDITVPSSTSPGAYNLFILATTGTFIENDVGSAVYSIKQVQINVEQVNNPPNLPTNPTPQNGAINQLINPTLSWTGGDPDSGDLVTYDVYLDSSPNPTTKQYSSITSTSCSINGLNYEQQYYWQVVAKDNKDTYTAGPIWTFSTGPQSNNPPNIPSNPFPINGANNQPLNPVISWSGGDPDAGDLVTYDVYLDTNPNPTTQVCSTTSTSCSVSGLEHDTTYYWKVDASDGELYTTSLVWSFITKPLTVCSSGCGYTSIQAAIDAAKMGDTIEVYSGTYYENVNVNKQLNLQGFDTGNGAPVVDGSGVMYTISLNADGISLTNFNITNSRWDGIVVYSNYNTLVANRVYSNSRNGIVLFYSSNNTLIENNVSNNIEGIMLYYSNNNTLTGNNISNNERGIILKYSNNSILNDNTALYNTYEGIQLTFFSRNNTLIYNNFSSNSWDGIDLISSNDNNITENNVLNNRLYGISITGAVSAETGEIFQSNNNNVSGNNLLNNNVGIRVVVASNNTINNNNIRSNNEYGISLESSSDNNIIFHNYLINVKNAYDTCSNSWDFGSQGNYYSDYNGIDSNGDGIGDTPYLIPGDSNIDYYPLMQPSPDNIPPAIISSYPVDGSVNVPLTQRTVSFTFNEPMQPNVSVIWWGLNDDYINNASLVWSLDQKTISFTFDMDLPANTMIRWDLNPATHELGFKDLAGNPLPADTYSGSFNTSSPGSDNIPPVLISSNPADGSTNIPVTQRTVSFTFNESMQPDVSVTWWNLNEDYVNNTTTEWSLDQKTVYFTFDRDLTANTMVAWDLNPSTHGLRFKDLAGNPLPADLYSGSFNTSSSVSDNIPPVFLSSNPADGIANIPVTQRTISFTFNEAMQPSVSITWWGVSEEMVSNITSIEWSPDQKTVYFTYDRNLPADTIVRWDLNPSTHELGFKDLAGNPLPPDTYSGNFNTSSSVSDNIPPVLISSNPADGSTNIPVTQRTVSFTFNEAMQHSDSILWWGPSNGTELNNFELSPDQKTITYTFDRDLPADTIIKWLLNPSTYELGFKDLAGNPLPSDTYSGSFNTSSSVSDNIPPVLISSNPADGSTNIPVTQRTVSFTFNESMQPSISVTWWNLNEDYVNNAATEWSLDEKTVSFTFDRDLPANTMVAWDLNPSTHGLGFKDLAGNPLSADMYSGSFNTSSSVSDNIPPVFLSSNPADGIANIPVTQRTISFTFNEAMQPNVSVYSWGLNDNYSNNASIDWSPDQKTVYFTFDRDLPDNTTISWVLSPSAHLNGFCDLSGNPLPADTYFVRFSTAFAVENQLINTSNGIARLSTPDGFIVESSAVDESSLPPLPDVEFPFGVFKFNISDLNFGQTVDVSIELPQELPGDARYWKYGGTISVPTPHWYEIPMEISSDNRSIKIQLTDGGLGDDDLIANGEIVDPGAPSVSRTAENILIQLNSGWNLISLPLMPENSNIESALSGSVPD